MRSAPDHHERQFQISSCTPMRRASACGFPARSVASSSADQPPRGAPVRRRWTRPGASRPPGPRRGGCRARSARFPRRRRGSGARASPSSARAPGRRALAAARGLVVAVIVDRQPREPVGRVAGHRPIRLGRRRGRGAEQGDEEREPERRATNVRAAHPPVIGPMRAGFTRRPRRWPGVRGSCSGALAAPVHQLQHAADQLRGARLVREHVDVPLGREAGHEDRLLLRVLADAVGAVARAQAGRPSSRPSAARAPRS